MAPPIIDAPIVAAEEIGDAVTDNELVLGVVINGAARAYPINMLTGPTREIINDELGGQSIAASWCHACHTAVVYLAELNGRPLTFQVSGMFWQQSLVMQDVQTNSLWSHLLGECKQGELYGAKLKLVPSQILTWAAWKARHPETTILRLSRTSRNYTDLFYSFLYEYVIGLDGPSGPEHVSLWRLGETPVLNADVRDRPLLFLFDPVSKGTHVFRRNVGTQTLTFQRDESGRLTDAETHSVWSDDGIANEGELSGKRLEVIIGIPSYRSTWLKFHPDSYEVGGDPFAKGWKPSLQIDTE